MVYKPRKTVNGHKRNDRSTRRRKARDARKRRAAARPVRSNVKRYVAEQFGKTHPDNRYYLSYPTLKPSNKLDDTPRYYPFGAHFQKEFLEMEFRRMKEVVTQIPAQVPIRGGRTSHTGHGAEKYGNFNHWRSLLGRGIHMKHASVYGSITLNERIFMSQMEILKYGNLKLHMFVLEDKAVTKTEFLNWYKNFLATNSNGQISTDPSDEMASEVERNITSANGPVDHGVYDKDILRVPYVAGSKYVSGTSNVCGEGSTSSERPPSGFDEFLIDWTKFYKIGDDNPVDSLFYNEVKCTTDWDGTRAKSLLPVNKSRFIVHEHKTWSFKPKANGCLDTVIPFEYTFPEHYMHYDKELLDMPFVWNTDNSSATLDNSGLRNDWIFTRKQPFIVFVYTCDNPWLIGGPTRVHGKQAGPDANEFHFGTDDQETLQLGDDTGHATETAMETSATPGADVSVEQVDGDFHVKRAKLSTSHDPQWYGNPSRVAVDTTTVRKGDIFHIDMHFKCTYENKLSTSIVPTINKGRPIIHKRELPAPKPAPAPKRTLPLRKTTLPKKDFYGLRGAALPKWMQGPKPSSTISKAKPQYTMGSAAAAAGWGLGQARATNDMLSHIKNHPLESFLTVAGVAATGPVMGLAARLGARLGPKLITGLTAERAARRYTRLGETANAIRAQRVARTEIGPGSEVYSRLGGRLRKIRRIDYRRFNQTGIQMEP